MMKLEGIILSKILHTFREGYHTKTKREEGYPRDTYISRPKIGGRGEKNEKENKLEPERT